MYLMPGAGLRLHGSIFQNVVPIRYLLYPHILQRSCESSTSLLDDYVTKLHRRDFHVPILSTLPVLHTE